jgi:hypothetical protein
MVRGWLTIGKGDGYQQGKGTAFHRVLILAKDERCRCYLILFLIYQSSLVHSAQLTTNSLWSQNRLFSKKIYSGVRVCSFPVGPPHPSEKATVRLWVGQQQGIQLGGEAWAEPWFLLKINAFGTIV